MKYFDWYYHRPAELNVGDSLSEPILSYFLKGVNLRRAEKKDSGKLVSCGSVMSMVKSGDTVWGTGCIRNKELRLPNVKFLAVRGKLTRGLIKGSIVPEVYGDPALLLPLIYNPKIEKKYKVGIIPHYVDKDLVKGEKIISVALNWKEFVNEVLSCEQIISSSLHGIIIAEAYGIPATWAVYSDKLTGGQFKFQDYFSGTGRKEQKPFTLLPAIENIKNIQDNLLKALVKRTDIP